MPLRKLLLLSSSDLTKLSTFAARFYGKDIIDKFTLSPWGKCSLMCIYIRKVWVYNLFTMSHRNIFIESFLKSKTIFKYRLNSFIVTYDMKIWLGWGGDSYHSLEYYLWLLNFSFFLHKCESRIIIITIYCDIFWYFIHFWNFYCLHPRFGIPYWKPLFSFYFSRRIHSTGHCQTN